MTTPNYEIPTINGNASIDIAGDVNASLNAIDSTLTNFKKHYLDGYNIVFFGDSFLDPDIPNSVNGICAKFISEALKMKNYNFAKAGAGFGRASNLINTQITTADNSMSDSEKENTKAVVMFGGFNDLNNNVSSNDIANGVDVCVTNANNIFKNATIYLVLFNWAVNLLDDENLETMRLTEFVIKRNMYNKTRVQFIDNARYWNLGFKTSYQNRVHPNELGYRNIASHIVSGILGGSTDVNIEGTFSFTHGSTAFGKYSLHNDMVRISRMYFSFQSNLSSYSDTIVTKLPTYMTPQHDIIFPIMTTTDTVGYMRLSTANSEMKIYISSLSANTLCFTQPISYDAQAYQTVSFD